jgi:hypothetical protein
VDALTIDRLKQAVLDAGIEIYGVNGRELRIAERVRMHLMDSGVTITVHSDPQVTLTVRSQRSDFPTAPEAELFDKIRGSIGRTIEQRGFREVRAQTRDITDPIDESHVLDVWHELTFAKESPSLDGMIEDVVWALAVPKCVDP